MPGGWVEHHGGVEARDVVAVGVPNIGVRHHLSTGDVAVVLKAHVGDEHAVHTVVPCVGFQGKTDGLVRVVVGVVVASKDSEADRI